MSRKNQIFCSLLVFSLVAFASLACSFSGSPGVQSTSIPPTQTIVPTPDCGGDVSGHWEGTVVSATRNDAEYTMDLVQQGCQVSGTETTFEDGRFASGPVSGYVESGIFHFTEDGDTPETCYWIGELTLQAPGNLMTGVVSNCNQPTLTLHR